MTVSESLSRDLNAVCHRATLRRSFAYWNIEFGRLLVIPTAPNSVSLWVLGVARTLEPQHAQQAVSTPLPDCGAGVSGCCFDGRWSFVACRCLMRRATPRAVGPFQMIQRQLRGEHRGRRGLHWRALVRGDSHIGVVGEHSVSEEAVFDGRYNLRLHPTHGARSRAPRVPALRCIVTPRGAGEPDRYPDSERIRHMAASYLEPIPIWCITS